MSTPERDPAERSGYMRLFYRDWRPTRLGRFANRIMAWWSATGLPPSIQQTIEVRGRNLVTGLPETVEVSSVEIREALSGAVQVIVDTVRDALDEIPPEMVSDLMDIGICLSGGGALLQGLADRLTEELKLRVWLAEDPLTCVARGAAAIYEDFENLGRYLVGLERGSTRHRM